MSSEVHEQHKQERHRTRWTASLDKIFADIVVQQVQSGNRRNNVFEKKTWNYIRNEFNKQTNLNFNNNQLRKHLDVLRIRYYNLTKSSSDQSDFIIDDSYCIGHELWDDKRRETTKIKDCPVFDQLCTIFADSGAEGKYAQSSHFEELDTKAGKSNPADLILSPRSGTPCIETPLLKTEQGVASPEENATKDADKKIKRTAKTGPAYGARNKNEVNVAMAEALLEMVAASKLRAVTLPKQVESTFTITDCIKALNEMKNIDDRLYYAALDLFEDPKFREMFISLKGDKTRLTMLQGRCVVNGTA